MKLIWLSHVLDTLTPVYGGVKNGVLLQSNRSIAGGDSCNVTSLCFSSHTGTHVDAPYHFISQGETIDAMPPEAWIFSHPCLIDIPISTTSKLLNVEDFKPHIMPDINVDFLLIRTGFEKYRSQRKYWTEGPGISSLVADFIKGIYPQIRAIGMDFISISSFSYREQGREAHKAFLSRDIVLFEDMKMFDVGNEGKLEKVVALPLRFVSGDGAPCTIIGWLKE